MFSRLIRNAITIGILCLGIAAAQAGTATAAGQIEGFAATASASQAGGHPDLGASITIANQSETAKALTIELPPGLVAYLNSVPQCSLADLATVECPPSSQVGLATTRRAGFPSFLFGTAPIYAVTPAGGDAYGRLAFTIPTLAFTQSLLVGVRAGGDYGLRVELPNLPAAAPLRRLDLTLWGAPSDPVHDGARFPQGSEGCPGEVGADCNTEPTASSAPLTPLTGYPRACGRQPLPLTLSLQTYQDPEVLTSASATLTGATGCQFLGFSPSSALEASASSRTSTFLDLELTMPQEPSIATPTPSSARSASIDFGGALRLDQAAVDARAVCTAAQAGIGTEVPAACPVATKIGNVRFRTPLVPEGMGGPNPLRAAGPAIGGAHTRVAVPGVAGSAYFGGPAPGGGVRVYLLPTGFAINVKLELLLAPDPVSGALVASIALPEFPVAAIDLKIPESSSVLRTAVRCGAHTATSTLVPWSSPQSEVVLTQPLNLDTGPGATPCPGAPTKVQVGLKPPLLVANGSSSTTVTALVSDKDGIPVPGEEVEITSSDGGQGIGPVTDNEDGTYSARVTSSTTVGTSTITATVKSAEPELSGSAPLQQESTVRVGTPPAPPPAPKERVIPVVTIGKHPPRRTRRRRAVFTFSADVPGSTFFCKVDGQATYRRCPSPTTLSGLAVGRHRLSVYAVAPSGATGVPAVVRFTVLAPKRRPS